MVVVKIHNHFYFVEKYDIIKIIRFGDCKMEEINDLFDTLNKNFKMCHFKLIENDRISFKILCSGVLGSIEKLIPAGKTEGYYYVWDRSSGANTYYKHIGGLFLMLERLLQKYRAEANHSFEVFFRNYAKSFSSSFAVADDEHTVFSNITVLKHKNNSFLKGLIGKNRYETVFATGFFIEGKIMYCVSLYTKNGEFDTALCSTQFPSDLPATLNAALSIQRNFEFM